VQTHARHELLLMAHAPAAVSRLGRIVVGYFRRLDIDTRRQADQVYFRMPEALDVD
jgi:uncharacterized protein YbgA (DUF1722 family)